MADTQTQRTTFSYLAVSPQSLDPELTRVLQVVSLAQRLHPTEFSAAWAAFDKTLHLQHMENGSLADPQLRGAFITFAEQIRGMVLTAEEQPLVETPSPDIVDATNQLVENERQQVLSAHAFSERLVDNYITQLGLQKRGDLKENLTQSLDRALPDILREQYDAAGVVGRATGHLANVAGVNLPMTPQENLVAAAAQVAQGARDQATNLVRTAAVARRAITLDAPEKSVATAVLLSLSYEQPDLPEAALVAQAEQAGYLAAALSVDPTAAEAGFAQQSLLGFFGRIAKTRQEQLWAPLADVVLAVVPRKTQETIVATVLEKSFDRALDEFTRRFGSRASQAVQPLFAQSTQSYRAGAPLSVASSGVGRFFGDAFGGIFRSAPEGAVRAYLELIHIRVVNKPVTLTLPYWYFAADRQRFGEGFSFELLDGIWQWAARTGTKSAASTSKAGVTVGVASREVARQAMVGLLERVGLSGLVGTFTGPVGIFVAQAVLWLGEKLVKPVLRAVGGFIGNILTGRVGPMKTAISAIEDYARSAGLSPPQKKKWYEKEWVLIGALVVLVVVFPALVAFNVMIRYMPLSVSAWKVKSLETEELPEYLGPLPPVSALAGCPVTGGTITQRPFNPYGSHAHANAYDIGGLPEGTPVSIAHDGYIAQYRNSFARGQYLYSSYGNFVMVVGTNATGQRFFTIYAHLWDVSSDVVRAAASGALVKAGTVIGRLDTTGYTYGWRGPGTGTHLHYEYKGPGAFQLPPGCAGA